MASFFKRICPKIKNAKDRFDDLFDHKTSSSLYVHNESIAEQLELRNSRLYIDYLDSLRPVQKLRAEFAICYPDNKPVVSSKGKYLYFSTAKKAFEVQGIIAEFYKINTVVVCDPSNKKGMAGQRAHRSAIKEKDPTIADTIRNKIKDLQYV